MCFFIRAIEEFIRRYPQHANFKRPVDSHVALHVAAVNNRFDVVSFLAQTVELHVFWGLTVYCINIWCLLSQNRV